MLVMSPPTCSDTPCASTHAATPPGSPKSSSMALLQEVTTSAWTESRIRARTRWSPAATASAVAAPIELATTPIHDAFFVVAIQSSIRVTSRCSQRPIEVTSPLLWPLLRRSNRTRL